MARRSEDRLLRCAVLSAIGALLMLLGITGCSAAPTSHSPSVPSADQCDWTGSGGSGKGVRPVYLRCSRGGVSWRYPKGALRVVLSNGGGSHDRIFRGCVKASGPARVYLESKNSLKLLYAPGDGKHEALHRCFGSRAGMAALYVEADGGLLRHESGPEGQHLKVRLHYDLEPARFFGAEEDGGSRRRSARVTADEPEQVECRPCSKEELAEAYCQSDLVARGTVSAVERRPEIESSELRLRITKTLRRVDENEENEVDSGDPRLAKEVRIRVPMACDARHGPGEFVIMAKKRLGDLALSCAPRLEEWAEAVRDMESAPCVLKS
ncbi:meteorin-like protein [Copidosoma floridanum]|uniref:meteorin-like protein n=1 Tax=Copidosoma floridanum TaxID=29053 RepID=UPI0006C94FEB|nr:meteorin-like protein [Copidosoma floridanum]